MKYKIGDKVRVVSKWGPGCCPDNRGFMDEWLGKVMTIVANYHDYYIMKEDHGRWFWNDAMLVGPANIERIIVTTDGTKVTARMYCGKELIKAAQAKCSPRDEFDFKTGAALAVDRLLERETEKPAIFDKSILTTGRFGRLNNGVWFVVVSTRLVYLSSDGGYDDICDLDDCGRFPKQRLFVDCVVDAVSFINAQTQARLGHFIYVRPGAKFE